jgi:hypothetical protein
LPDALASKLFLLLLNLTDLIFIAIHASAHRSQQR